MKLCGMCNTEKDLSCFSKKGKGYQHLCKECRSKWFKEHYQKNKDYYLKRNKEAIRKTREWFIDYKSTLSCSVCGENHPACLDFHHTDPKQKEDTVGNLIRHSKSKLLKEIDKCIILCANCHRKHHHNERTDND